MLCLFFRGLAFFVGFWGFCLSLTAGGALKADDRAVVVHAVREGGEDGVYVGWAEEGDEHRLGLVDVHDRGDGGDGLPHVSVQGRLTEGEVLDDDLDVARRAAAGDEGAAEERLAHAAALLCSPCVKACDAGIRVR